MKNSLCSAIVLAVLLFLPTLMSARHAGPKHSRHGHHHPPQPSKREMAIVKTMWEREAIMKQRRADTVELAGSTLPDCSHACGSCTPCRLVMVSFVCASIEEAETCPIAYKCMCKNKSYPIP